MPTTTGLLLPYPALSAAPNIPADIQALADRLEVIHNTAWTAFTPTWTAATTNPVIGNGTLTGRYKQIGKTVQFRLKVLAGSTTTYGTGNYTFGGMPVAAAGTADPLSSVAGIVLGSNGTFPITSVQLTTTSFIAVYTGNVTVAQSTPCTLVAGGYIHFSGMYEAA